MLQLHLHDAAINIACKNFTVSYKKSGYKLYFEEQFFEGFSCLCRHVWCRGIPDRDDDDGFFRFGQLEKFVAALGIKVTNPAGAEALVGGCKAKVFHCDGDVDVAMRLTIGTNPFCIVQHGGQDVERCLGKPRAVVARWNFSLPS